MNKEEKNLLLKDLCGRLPYEVKVRKKDSELEGTVLDTELRNDLMVITTNEISVCTIAIEDCLLYLRPMSSMTEEEKQELDEKGLAYWDSGKYTDDDGYTIVYADKEIQLIPDIETYDWLNAHHFDYRELIPKGLALEAPKDMYKTE